MAWSVKSLQCKDGVLGQSGKSLPFKDGDLSSSFRPHLKSYTRYRARRGADDVVAMRSRPVREPVSETSKVVSCERQHPRLPPGVHVHT